MAVTATQPRAPHKPRPAIAISEDLMKMCVAQRYTDMRMVGKQLCAIRRFNFTTAVLVGITVWGYDSRYCYEHREEAQAALRTWEGDGHPPGPWIKCKGATVDLLNPEFCRSA